MRLRSLLPSLPHVLPDPVRGRGRRFGSIAAALSVALSLAACANSHQSVSPALDDQAEGPNDPLEKGNRVVWAVDMKLNDYVLAPVARAYRDHVPGPVQHGVTNVLRNISSPVILLNDTLQGNGQRAGDTFARLWVNTVLGLGGLIDVGTSIHIPYHDSDFGQTLGVWGIGPGPYLVLPLLGPSDPRDLAGRAADTVVDPFSYSMRQAGVSTISGWSRTGVGVVSDQSKVVDDLDELKRSSLDYYAAIRSLYQQKRVADVNEARQHSAFAASTSVSAISAQQAEIEADVAPTVQAPAATPPVNAVASPQGADDLYTQIRNENRQKDMLGQPALVQANSTPHS